jgi:protein SCO1/2
LRQLSLRTVHWACLLAVLFLFSCTSSASSAYPWQLELNDADGKTFSLREYEGKTLLLAFVFTHCPSACPMQTARMARVEAMLPDALKQRSAFVSISIDPRRDTREKLREFARAHHAQSSHWRFGLTQDTGALQTLLDRLSVKVNANTDGSIRHEMSVLLIDARGRIVQRYMGDSFDEARVAHELGAVDRLLAPRS